MKAAWRVGERDHKTVAHWAAMKEEHWVESWVDMSDLSMADAKVGQWAVPKDILMAVLTAVLWVVQTDAPQAVVTGANWAGHLDSTTVRRLAALTGERMAAAWASRRVVSKGGMWVEMTVSPLDATMVVLRAGRWGLLMVEKSVAHWVALKDIH